MQLVRRLSAMGAGLLGPYGMRHEAFIQDGIVSINLSMGLTLVIRAEPDPESKVERPPT